MVSEVTTQSPKQFEYAPFSTLPKDALHHLFGYCDLKTIQHTFAAERSLHNHYSLIDLLFSPTRDIYHVVRIASKANNLKAVNSLLAHPNLDYASVDDLKSTCLTALLDLDANISNHKRFDQIRKDLLKYTAMDKKDLGIALSYGTLTVEEAIVKGIVNSSQFPQINLEDFKKAIIVSAQINHVETLKTTISNFESLSPKDRDSLMMKIAKDHENIVQILIKSSLYPKIKANILSILLTYAAESGSKETIKAVTDHPEIKNVPTKNLALSLVKAALNGYEQVVQSIINNTGFKDIPREEKLKYLIVAWLSATENGHKKTADILLKCILSLKTNV